MGNRKPRSKSDRIPVASLAPRKTMHVDPVPNREAMLTLPAMTPQEREQRNAAAVRYLLQHDGGDLVEMLGLAATPPPLVQRLAPSRISIVSVGCPQCGAGSGARCFVASTGMVTSKPHTARRRKAEERREATS